MESKMLKNDLEGAMRLFCPKGSDTSSTGKSKDAGEEEKGGTPNMQDIDRFGLYQLIMYVVIMLPLLLSAGATLSYVFTAGEVKYRCIVPECEDPSNTTFNLGWLDYSAPRKDQNPGSCKRYIPQNQSGICTNGSFTNMTENCDAWLFDGSETTIQNEWELTCDTNRWKLTLVGTINNVGQFFGLIFAGYVSDRYGRRTILTLATFLSGISGLIHSFSVNYWMFLAFEFLDATAAAGLYSAAFILGMEMAGVKKRVIGGTITSCMFAVGEILLGLLAMWLRSWRALLRVIYAPALFAIFLPFLIPESVRWLLAHGKHKEVEKIYRNMARINGLQVSEEAISMFKELTVGKEKEKNDQLVVTETKGPVVQVLNSSVILTRLVTCSFCWLANNLVYYGLSLNSVAFAGDKYVNFILVAIVEIPAYFLTLLLTDSIGRKTTLSGSFLLSGAFCLAIQFVPPGLWSYTPLILYMGGKWCITMAFAVVYVYTAEMFPTSLRHSLLGVCSMTGRIGSILAPQTPLLANVMPELPLILFGCIGLCAGLLSLIFPETLGMKLPDTVWEAENIGKVQAEQDPQNSPH